MRPRLLRIGTMVMTAVGLAVLLAIPELLADSTPECEQAEHWVRVHSGSLPSAYDDVTAFPDVYRRRIFEVLPPEVKAALWGEHLDRALRQSELTTSQRELVRAARQWVTADRYRNHEKPPTALVEGIKRAFSPAMQVEMFQALGPMYGRISLRTWRIVTAQWATRAVEALAEPSCNCNVENGELCGFISPSRYCCCGTRGSRCTETSFGCGIFGCCSCFGLCMLFPDCV